MIAKIRGYVKSDTPKLPPIPFGEQNSKYPENLQILAKMAREKTSGDLVLLMNGATKSIADTTGDTEIMENATGLKIVTADTLPHGYVFVGNATHDGSPSVFPAAVFVTACDQYKL